MVRVFVENNPVHGCQPLGFASPKNRGRPRNQIISLGYLKGLLHQHTVDDLCSFVAQLTDENTGRQRVKTHIYNNEGKFSCNKNTRSFLKYKHICFKMQWFLGCT